MRKTALTLLGAVAVMAAAAPQKTAWGDPDLQGIWAQKYQTPLQRPARDAGKPVLTPEEVKQRNAERAQEAASAPKRGDRIAPRGTLEDLTGAYDITFEADSKNSLQAGTKIVVDGYRAKDGTNKMNAREIAFSDGRRLFAGSDGTGAPR